MSNAALPRPARRMIATVTTYSFGTGLTLPFTLILLHEVRGIDLSTVGLLLAAPGAVGLASVPIGGAQIDRFGARAVLRAALVLQALGSALLAFATTPLAVLPAVLLIGLGMGPSFSAQSALLDGLVEGTDLQGRAFGVQFTALNAAFGVGGLTAASFVDVGNPFTFQLLYLVNALSCLIGVAALPAAPQQSASRSLHQPSYREALADPALRRVCLVSLLLALSGYAALDGGLPAYARIVGHVSPRTIALIFTMNTVVIVGGQLGILRLLRDQRRSTSLAWAALLWGVSWSVLGVVPGLSQQGRLTAVLVFGGLFGLGETFMAPALQPLVNALATDRLRGRYNALSTGTFQLAFVFSPAVAALAIAHGHGTLWLAGLVMASVLCAVMAYGLRGLLNDEQDGLHPVNPGSAADPAVSLLG